MKSKAIPTSLVSGRSTRHGRATSDAIAPLGSLESRAARVISAFVRVLLLMGFSRSFITEEVRRALQSEKVRPMKRLEFDVREMGRVLARWANDPQFISDQGRPLDLPERGAKVSFEALVNAEMPGVDPEVCLDVLLGSQGVVRSRQGLIRFRNRIAQRVTGDAVAVEDSLRPIQGLLDTLAQNMMNSAKGKDAPVLECGVSGFRVGAADVSDLCHQAKMHGTLLLEQLDEWLAQRERRRRRHKLPGPEVRPYIGFFVAKDGGA